MILTSMLLYTLIIHNLLPLIIMILCTYLEENFPKT